MRTFVCATALFAFVATGFIGVSAQQPPAQGAGAVQGGAT